MSQYLKRLSPVSDVSVRGTQSCPAQATIHEPYIVETKMHCILYRGVRAT